MDKNPPIQYSLSSIKNLSFDIIGTCFDWHTPVSRALKVHASNHPEAFNNKNNSTIDWDEFAHEWRAEFFTFVARTASQGNFTPMSTVYQTTLDTLLQRHGAARVWDASERADLVKSWSMMEAWADAAPGLDALRTKFTVVSLTNGSTRTLIDAFKRDNVQMDAILTSDVTKAFKPNPVVYRTALKALECEDNPGQIAMVAAHAYDLEAAAKEGFKTIYIVRETEDIGLEPGRLEKFDVVVREGGLGELARRLGAV